MRLRTLVTLLTCLSCIPSCVGQRADSASGLGHRLFEIRWVAYAPTNFDPNSNPPKLPSVSSIRTDLSVLQSSGFNGLVTYGAAIPEVVEVAKSLGFKAVLLGVWDPASAEELRLAERSASDGIVLGLIVGNEGLMFKRYTLTVLMNAMKSLRATTGKPVSTTEVIESFHTKPELAEWSDFLTVNTHPFFHGKREPQAAVEWTVAAWGRLRERFPDKPILFKEVGLPTAGPVGLSEAAQEEYYSLLRKTDVRFVYFEAFDALFKKGAVEQSWGLFRADRSPKPAASILLRSRGTR